jgi:uncharacterized protein
MDVTYLTVPGVTNSSAGHWQSLWEKEFPDRFRRIEQVNWDTPVCKDWIAAVEDEVRTVGAENVIHVAHSLGCITVAHWAGVYGTRAAGALLVAPSDCEAKSYKFDTEGFGPVPLVKLGFPSLVVASSDDEYVSLDRARYFADCWGSEFINVGKKGHINGGSGYGPWREGLELLDRLG